MTMLFGKFRRIPNCVGIFKADKSLHQSLQEMRCLSKDYYRRPLGCRMVFTEGFCPSVLCSEFTEGFQPSLRFLYDGGLAALVAVDAASGVGVAAWAELVVTKGGHFRCVRRASRGRVSVVKRTLGQRCGVRRQSSSRRFRLWYEKLIYPFTLNCLLYTLLRRVINLIQVFQEEDPMRAEKRRRKSGKHKKSMECVVMQGKKIERLEYK
ncbi:hypothetical protein V8G54_027672 [Vigna mungo]|uniref:Uncharacterized protein n=1 Tax=Vigna mungo TaxID=3915 RepID=A0AAQ3N3C3_VIGMU